MAIPRIKTELEEYLVYGIDEKNRRIFFGKGLDHGDDEVEWVTDFSHTSVQMAVRAIKRMESDHPKKPIELHVCSCGGDPSSMLYLHDVMISSTCQFKFYGGGIVGSSATWIMAAADERYLYPNTNVLIHDGDMKAAGKTTDVDIENEQNKKLQQQLEKLYTENSRMPREFWEEVSRRDLWLTAEETVMVGLADKIIEPKKRGNFRKIRQAGLKKKINKEKMKDLVNSIYKRIHLGSKMKDIQLHVPREEVDESLVIDSTPVKQEEVDALHKKDGQE